MLRETSTRNQNIVIGIFIAISLILQHFFLSDLVFGYTVMMTLGVVLGFYIAFGKKVIPGIVVATTIVSLVLILIDGNTFIIAFMRTVSRLLLYIVGMYLLELLLSIFECKIPSTIKKSVIYLLILIVVSIVLALLSSIQYVIFRDLDFIKTFVVFLKSISIGLAIFTTANIFSNHYDPPFTINLKALYRDVVYVISFTMLAILIFDYTRQNGNFALYGQLFIVLFLINAYAFNYRTILLTSFIYIMVYNYLLILPNNLNNMETINTMNLYLLVLVSITIFTKVLIYLINEKNESLNITNERLEVMMDSTIALMRINDKLDPSEKTFKHDYMKTIFNIATNIFEKAEAGIASIYGFPFVEVVDVKGYNLNEMSKMKVKSDSTNWNVNEPVYYFDGKAILKDILGSEQFNKVEKTLPEIKETIRFGIKIDSDTVGTIRLDILETSKEVFNSADFENITAFQKLINSFQEINELSLKNNNLRDDIVLSLIRTLELFDHYTGGHSEDVANISWLIANEMKLDKDTLSTMYWAGIVHDIGKIGVSADIINKTTKLTLEEYKKIKEHPIFGYQILRKSEDLKPIALLVKHHHEWWNGSGYPDGISGDAIPLGSQVLQLADSLSAMTTKRPYSIVKTKKEILAEIEMYTGTQFSPIISEVVVKLINKGNLDFLFNR